MNNRLPWLAIALMAIATPVTAQSAPPTRAEEARRAREERATIPPPANTGKVERFLNWVEGGALFSAQPRDGFGVHVGIPDGPALALGPAWRTSNALGGALHLSAAAAVSAVGDRELTGQLGLPRLAGRRLTAAFVMNATHLAQERFYGTGMTSVRTDGVAFALDQRRAMANATLSARPWLQVSGGAGTLYARTADPRRASIAPISARFTAESAAGMGFAQSFRVISLGAAVDTRDASRNPRSGGHYAVAAKRHTAAPQSPHSFTQLDTAVEQHFSFWKRQRTITLRALASTTFTADGQAVPFYLQPSLGGSQVLRGFVNDRFRDRSLLALQAEYGWDLTPFISAVAFYETGAVGSALRSITARDFRRDYGLGFRFGSARTVAFRTDVAFGSGEGTRLTMRFNHAF